MIINYFSSNLFIKHVFNFFFIFFSNFTFVFTLFFRLKFFHYFQNRMIYRILVIIFIFDYILDSRFIYKRFILWSIFKIITFFFVFFTNASCQFLISYVRGARHFTTLFFVHQVYPCYLLRCLSFCFLPIFILSYIHIPSLI